ncbi:MAG: hypothetical protein BAJALOKI1v1_1190003 [Promethearchaeota archaeon]|nr:MAG: hypothetical protein BAJALOKI1v1_1190003 [Candidatus Lokiarchaeota archaeon]
MKGSAFENDPHLKDYVKTLEEAFKSYFYCDAIDEFYTFFRDPDNYNELFAYCLSLENSHPTPKSQKTP